MKIFLVCNIFDFIFLGEISATDNCGCYFVKKDRIRFLIGVRCIRIAFYELFLSSGDEERRRTREGGEVVESSETNLPKVRNNRRLWTHGHLKIHNFITVIGDSISIRIGELGFW